MIGYRSSGDSALPGERTLWSGPAGHGILFQSMDIFLVPFSLLWCGMALFISFGSGVQDAPMPFDLFGLIFVVVGFYAVFGRFIIDMVVRRSISYTLTTHRVRIDRSGFLAKRTVIMLRDLPPVSLRIFRSGRGSIRFGEQASPWMGNRGLGFWSPALDPTPQFLAIDDPEHVFDLIQHQSDALRRSQ